jgi:hypothetical protein
MKYLILTYQDNLQFAQKTQEVLKNDWGVEAEIIIGYKIDDKQYTRFNVICHGIYDKIVTQFDDDIYYLEDDVRFTKHPLDGVDLSLDIVWSVYRRGNMTTNKNKYICGSQAIYFSKQAIMTLKKYMDHKKFRQIDSYLSVFILSNPRLSFYQLKPKIGYEKEHDSLISKSKDWIRYMKPN